MDPAVVTGRVLFAGWTVAVALYLVWRAVRRPRLPAGAPAGPWWSGTIPERRLVVAGLGLGVILLLAVVLESCGL